MPISPGAERRRRLIVRALPIAAIAAAAFIAGFIIASGGVSLDAARRFAAAWERRDFHAMHAELSDRAARRYPVTTFERLYRRAEATATVRTLDAGQVESAKTPSGADAAAFDVSFRTNAFGLLRGRLVLPVADGRIDWTPSLVFPGLRAGERLERRTRIPPRAAILATDGSALAEGPASARSSPLGAAATAVAGSVSAPKGHQAAEQLRLGFPPGSPTGTSGLELAFNRRLEGRPGGQLLVAGRNGSRVIASTQPVPGKPVHTTISPRLQEAAVLALGGTYGGVAVLDARRGSVLGLAGIAFSGPQPPGSTFKLITTTAALDAGVVKTSDQFPIQTQSVVGGRVIANAHNEACGGSFAQAFAESCNSVFVPLGPKIGSSRLVSTAERYGFNSPPSLYDRAALRAVDLPASTLPKRIDSDLDLGVTAIGQGEVLATPLEMASVAQAIANRGVREPTPIVRDPELRPAAKAVRVTSPATAATLRTLMLGVVHYGTGTAAALPGVEVAGKTGTAELGPLNPSAQGKASTQRVDAWFTCFAPAARPSLVVAVMVVDANGDGGTVAAPIARQVLATGLGVG
jgi:transpeptidase family protein/MecA-like transpeptidase family protein/penicillin-binding protein